jgi:hypothetical protein
VVFGERHLRYVLSSYKDYYNAMRTHLSLNKDARSLAALSGPGISSAARFWVNCTINMAGCDFTVGTAAKTEPMLDFIRAPRREASLFLRRSTFAV